MPGITHIKKVKEAIHVVVKEFREYSDEIVTVFGLVFGTGV